MFGGLVNVTCAHECSGTAGSGRGGAGSPAGGLTKECVAFECRGGLGAFCNRMDHGGGVFPHCLF